MAQHFHVRFMAADEIGRVAALIKELQILQKMKKCPRIPNGEELQEDIAHRDPKTGDLIPNNCGTFTVVAIDEAKADDPTNKSYIVGYLMYTEAFSVMVGPQYWVNSFFIEADYRRSGLGGRLMEFMYEHARVRGIARVDIPVMRGNVNGLKFYAKFSSYNVEEEYKIRAIQPGMYANDSIDEQSKGTRPMDVSRSSTD